MQLQYIQNCPIILQRYVSVEPHSDENFRTGRQANKSELRRTVKTIVICYQGGVELLTVFAAYDPITLERILNVKGALRKSLF